MAITHTTNLPAAGPPPSPAVPPPSIPLPSRNGVAAVPGGPKLIAGRKYVWELPIRLTHWVNAIAIAVLFPTGLFIAAPILMPGGEAANHFVMGTVRELHFAFGFALIVAVLLRIHWFFVGNNYARSGFPFFWRASWYKAVFQQVVDYMHLERGHIHIGHNSLAGASYAAFFAMCGFEGDNRHGALFGIEPRRVLGQTGRLDHASTGRIFPRSHVAPPGGLADRRVRPVPCVHRALRRVFV